MQNAPDINGILTFLQDAERLKDTLRSGKTRQGRQESVAEHSWRLCLLAMLVSSNDPAIDLTRLLKLCIIHDLGEALGGDVPAIAQTTDDDRDARELRDLERLCTPLSADLQAEILALWKEYNAGETPEAVMAKGLDKIETMLQHNLTPDNPDIDFAFNLTYGAAQTAKLPLLSKMREFVDRETAAIAEKSGKPD